MSSSEQPEQSGTAGPYPAGGSFAVLLDWHLDAGTRPDNQGETWGNEEFDLAITGSGRAKADPGRIVRYWRTGKRRPNDFTTIARLLFGSNQSATYVTWRDELRAAYDKPIETSPVPPMPVHFLGRDADVTAIVNALTADQRPLTILVQGGPGIGKTALTKVVGCHDKIVQRFGQANRWFVELETANTAAAMQEAITRAVGGDPARGFQATLEGLGRRPGLLVLDNLETSWDPKHERCATEAILGDLATVPGLALLASFRGEDVVRGVSWAYIHPVTRLDPPHDTELFCLIANWQRRDDPDLLRLINALGGIPLAIELVALNAYGQNSLAQLWARWVRKGVELAQHPDYDRGRLTSLPHSIALSAASSRLTPDAYRLFRLLGQLPAGLAEQDQDALLGDDGFDAQKALRRIGLAVDHAGRLDLLPPIRDHAARYCEPEVSDAAAWPAYYLGLTKQLGEAIGKSTGDGAVSRLIPEFANIEAAFRAMLKAGRNSEAMAALEGFGALASIASLPTPILVDLAKACRSAGDVLGEANCIFSLGDIALRRSDHEEARRAFEEALPLYQRIGGVLGEANCISSLGAIALRRSDYEEARRAFEEALPLYRRIDRVLGEANCIFSLGDLARRQSDYTEAERAFKEALPLYRRIGRVLGEAYCISSLGTIALGRSDYAEAERAFKEALPLHQRTGDMLGEANCIKGRGDIALGRSDYEGARKAFKEALLLYQRIGDALGEANCIGILEKLGGS